MKGIIYYTDNRIREPLLSLVRGCILNSGLPIVSCSLEPTFFGENVILGGVKRGYHTMVTQILIALKVSEADYVFFCEHDVLYHKSHFDFKPPRDDIYYYNSNNYRWNYPKDRAITYDRLLSLSMLCCNRQLAVNHYKMRKKKIEELGWDKLQGGREPRWVRRMGYEPGTKKIRRGGLTDEDCETWKSEYPNIDIRHKKTFSRPKITLDSFKHMPNNWKEVKLAQIPGWGLKELFESWI